EIGIEKDECKSLNNTKPTKWWLQSPESRSSNGSNAKDASFTSCGYENVDSVNDENEVIKDEKLYYMPKENSEIEDVNKTSNEDKSKEDFKAKMGVEKDIMTTSSDGEIDDKRRVVSRINIDETAKATIRTSLCSNLISMKYAKEKELTWKCMKKQISDEVVGKVSGIEVDINGVKVVQEFC
ncbi:17768_t:CDS:2, partial [Dentiscutata erythropus]